MKKIKAFLSSTWNKVRSTVEVVGGFVGAIVVIMILCYVIVKVVKLFYIGIKFLWFL